MTPNITAAPKGSEGYQLGQTAWGVSTSNQSVPFPLTLFLISVLIFLPIYLFINLFGYLFIDLFIFFP